MKALTLNPWREISAARIPAVHLEALAPLRDKIDIRIHLQKEAAWVRWSDDRCDPVPYLLPVPGVELFTIRSGIWFRFRSLLPAAETPPESDGVSLTAVLFPEPFVPVQPKAITGKPVILSIVRCTQHKPTSALVCTIQGLQRWADTATTAEISRVKGVRAIDRAILVGSQFPSIPTATRYWGDDVFTPIGYRPEPNLPPTTLKKVVFAETNEWVFLNEKGATVVLRTVFEPLTRAGIRLALVRS